MTDRPRLDSCYGCWWYSPNTTGCDAIFQDTRTGHLYCHECILALASWEADGCPDPDEHPYRAWFDDSMEVNA